MGNCNQCPKWNSIVPEEERLCTDDIKYCVCAAYNQCSKHGQMFIATNEVEVPYCLECERNPCNDVNAKKKPRMKKKYIRQQRSEMMSEFMKEGGTYHISI
jgi:hypothetical protein